MKFAVMGAPGAGKTIFSKELGLVLGIREIYNLDYYLWKPGWIKTTQGERLEILKQLTKRKSWIIEGNYTNTIDYQLSVADVVILLKIPAIICLYRILSQQITYLLNERPEIAPRCPDRFSYNYLKSILTYYPINYQILIEKLQFYNQTKFIVIKNNKEIRSFLKNPIAKLPNNSVS